MTAGACRECLRRTWLVASLAGGFAWAARRPGALDPVFALSDQDLIAALASGARARDLRAAHRAFDPSACGRACERAGLELLCRHQPGYPARLRDLEGPPALLHVAGAGRAAERLVAVTAQPAVAIVGARRASAYGVEVARALARDLAATGVTVVSGMALGIDSAAHEGALEGGGATVAVLGGGADVPYPATKRALHERIRATGCVVSELPPGFAARRWCFPARNRVIAALCGATVVVEAAARSGSLITARAARELGREVCAVPGRITSGHAAGANALIRDGAQLVTGAQDVLDLLFGVGGRKVAAGPDRRVLGPEAGAVLDQVSAGRDTLEALVAAGHGARAAMAALGELELEGFVRRAPGGRYEPVP